MIIDKMEGAPGKPAGQVKYQYKSVRWPVGVPGSIAAGEAKATIPIRHRSGSRPDRQLPASHCPATDEDEPCCSPGRAFQSPDAVPWGNGTR